MRPHCNCTESLLVVVKEAGRRGIFSRTLARSKWDGSALARKACYNNSSTSSFSRFAVCLAVDSLVQIMRATGRNQLLGWLVCKPEGRTRLPLLMMYTIPHLTLNHKHVSIKLKGSNSKWLLLLYHKQRRPRLLQRWWELLVDFTLMGLWWTSKLKLALMEVEVDAMRWNDHPTT